MDRWGVREERATAPSIKANVFVQHSTSTSSSRGSRRLDEEQDRSRETTPQKPSRIVGEKPPHKPSTCRVRSCHACWHALIEASKRRKEPPAALQPTIRKPATLDAYDQNSYYKLRMAEGNSRPAPRPPTIRGDGNAYAHLQRKIAGLRALCVAGEAKCPEPFDEEPRHVGTVELLTQNWPLRDKVRPSQEPLLRVHDDDIQRNRKVLIPLGPSSYWTGDASEYTRKTHRQLFNDSLISMYAGLRDTYLQRELWSQEDMEV